ncbi:hypothetical protein BJX76DRAFT_326103 [Aspergillus varians]
MLIRWIFFLFLTFNSPPFFSYLVSGTRNDLVIDGLPSCHLSSQLQRYAFFNPSQTYGQFIQLVMWFFLSRIPVV